MFVFCINICSLVNQLPCIIDGTGLYCLDQFIVLVPELLGVSGFGQFWVREIGVKKLLV